MALTSFPNLFEIGTKELHQDAFLAWFMAWGDPLHNIHDSSLHQCAQDFIIYLISKQYWGVSFVIENVKSGRQWENIDVWAEVRTSEKNYLIIIEDKIYSGEHGEQLNKYKEAALQFCEEEKFEPVYIYLKSTSDSEINYRRIREKGFATITRIDLLNFLSTYDQVHNHIFKDFLNWLRKHESELSVFRTTTSANWGGKGWQGFYEAIESVMPVVGWHFVNRVSGDGFWNLCLNWADWNGFPVYLQIEQGPLCFKIATGENEIDFEGDFNRTQKRNEWHQIVMTKAKELGMQEVSRPVRFGNGNYMTAAYINKADWLGPEEEMIDVTAVVNRLQKYIDFLNDCLKQ